MQLKIKNKKLRIATRIFLFVFVLIPALIIAFASPIAKYLVEKYDVKYTGREIKMDWAYVNPFTGYVYFNNLKIHENGSDSLFFSSASVSGDFSIRKLFSGTIEIGHLTLNSPRTILIQTRNELNLDDVIEKFKPDSTQPKSKKHIHFSILSFTINNGELHYRETITPVHLWITKLNLESQSGIRWDSDTIAATYSFLSGVGKGSMKGDFVINTKNLDFHIASDIHSMELGFINQYLKDMVNYGTFRANLDAMLNTKGNFHDAQNLDATGKVAFTEFHFGKDTAEDYASFSKLQINIKQLSPKNHQYQFDTLLLMHPYFKFEQYDHLDNVQTMFGEKGTLVTAAQNSEKFNLVLEIGKYIKLISQNFLSSQYQIRRLAITDGDVHYNNFALNEEFLVSADPLSIMADSVDKNHSRVDLTFKTNIKPYGEVNVFLSINPKDSTDFDLTYHLDKFPLALFNPYLITYTSFPLDRGSIELQGKWTVRNGNIQSMNHLIILDPRVSKRIRKKDSKWIPLPLAMAFIRDRGNVIDYEIPITGNLKDPNFKLKDVILDLIRNIFVKPPTTPYRLEVRNTENKIEKSLNIKWEMRQYELNSDQRKFAEKMARFLKENPGAKITVHPLEYTEKEKEYILFFEAKKKYFMITHSIKNSDFSSHDSMLVDKMSNKDSSFVKYLEKCCHDSMLFTVQQRCYCFIGPEIVKKQFDELITKREIEFRRVFIANGTNKQVRFEDSENSIPYNGFSFYRITYNGEIPEYLQDAYAKLQKLNEEAPRLRYFRLRKITNAIHGQFKTK
jgi:hypothetical protein